MQINLTNILLFSIAGTLGYIAYLRHHSNKHKMATFTDITTALGNLTTAVNGATAALTGSITPAQGDQIVTAITDATTTLNAAVTPAP